MVLFLTYFLSLLFHLVTHRELFEGTSLSGQDDEAPWPLWQSITALAVATALVAWLSEFLVGSIEAARHTLGLTETFVGVVVIAFVGNAAEHSTAVWCAWKNKMDLSLGIATGSSLQMALFVTPVLVLASYAFGTPMNLEFSLPEIASIIFSIWIVGKISGDGESNWFEGVQLLSVYVIIALALFLSARAGIALASSSEAQALPFCRSGANSITIMLGLVRAFDRHAEILGLLLGQLRQFHADLLQVQARDFFVELFAQDVDADFVGVFVLPEIELREDLVGERVRHDEARMTGGATEIHEAAFGEHENLVAVGEGVLVDLRLDVGALDVFARRSAGRPESRYRNGRCCRRSPGLSSAPCARA